MSRHVPLNPRYSNFKQTFLTAGDAEQFAVFTGVSDPVVMDTFKYMFHKFRKGIFVSIKDSKIETFVPFCKAHFVNEYAHLMRADTDTDFRDLFARVSQLTERKMQRAMVYNTIYGWCANNGLLRYEMPDIEIDMGTDHIYRFIEHVCATHPVQDMSFFINKRDFPIRTLTGVEPYTCIWGEDHPLVSHVYPAYSPIFSMTTASHHADIPMPTWDDCRRVLTADNDKCNTETVKWVDKVPIAVFRGASTGLGVTAATNPRLKALSISAAYPELLDAGITKWNMRPRRARSSDVYRTIDPAIPKKYPAKNFMTYAEQSNHKYILNIPGHTTSFRLSTLLDLGSVVLHASDRYVMWFEPLLKPYVHYVPVRRDLRDLVERVKWCIANDALCETIARNAKTFHDEHLSLDGMARYMARQLNLNAPPCTPAVSVDKDTPSAFVVPSEQPAPPSSQTILDISAAIERGCPLIPLHVAKTGKRVHGPYHILADQYVLKPVNASTLHEHDMWTRCIAVLPCAYGFRRVYGVVGEHVALDYVHGMSMYEYLASPGRHRQCTDLNVVVDTLLQACIVLDHAHVTSGFVHNDCTPWNVIVNCNRGGGSDGGILVNGAGDTFEFIGRPSSVVTLIDYEKSTVSRASSESRDAFNLVVHTLFMVLSNPRKWTSGATVRVCMDIFKALFPAHPEYDMSKTSDMLMVLSLFKKYDNMTSTRLETVNRNVDLYDAMCIYDIVHGVAQTYRIGRPVRRTRYTAGAVNTLHRSYIYNSLKDVQTR